MQVHGNEVRKARRVWDVGSRWHGQERTIGRLQRDVWPLAVRSLGLEPGRTVLDVGCGSGHALPALRAAVGEHGRVVGVDVSPRMLQRARAEIERHGWTNVELREADATTAELGVGGFDAALAAFSLSTMPDLAAVVDRVHTALRPGGRLFVVDAHFGPGPPRLVRLLYRGVLGANGDDVLAALRVRFARVEPVVDTHGARVPCGETSWPPVAAALATTGAR